jgi:hypothetical protein
MNGGADGGALFGQQAELPVDHRVLDKGGHGNVKLSCGADGDGYGVRSTSRANACVVCAHSLDNRRPSKRQSTKEAGLHSV